MFKVNNKNLRHCSDAYNFFSVSIVDFDQINVNWVTFLPHFEDEITISVVKESLQ